MMDKSELIKKWQREYKYQIKMANNIGLTKPIRVKANATASCIRNLLEDLKNLTIPVVVALCEHADTEFQKLRCSVCIDCGEIVEIDI